MFIIKNILYKNTYIIWNLEGKLIFKIEKIDSKTLKSLLRKENKFQCPLILFWKMSVIEVEPFIRELQILLNPIKFESVQFQNIYKIEKYFYY